MKLEIKKIGEEFALILPQAILVTLGLSAGDFLDVDVSPDGALFLKLDTDYTSAMRISPDAMQEYRSTLDARGLGEGMTPRARWTRTAWPAGSGTAGRSDGRLTAWVGPSVDEAGTGRLGSS